MRRLYKTLAYTALTSAISFGTAYADDDDLDFLFDDEEETQTESVSTPPPESETSDAAQSSDGSASQSNEASTDTADVADNEDSQQQVAEAEQESAPPSDAEKRLVLEEIVVTAQKRAQSLADVPVSVTAVSGEKLTDAGIENLTDMSEYTPNFKLVDSGLIPNIYMRGVGSGSNQGFELSVGMFSDGIHLGRPHQTRAAFMDVERVEVLRGPQSILFGKNAIAGALNIVSATPGEEIETIFSGSLGLPNQDSELNAVLSGPVSDTFGARLAIRKRTETGYLYNRAQDRMEAATDETSIRTTFDWARKLISICHAALTKPKKPLSKLITQR